MEWFWDELAKNHRDIANMELSLPSYKILKSDPMIVIISGLSGSGKDTVINALRNNSKLNFHFVVTCNTRKQRDDEIDGVHYHFISREKFLDMIRKNEMVEYSPVYNDYKGVPKFEIEKGLAKGQDMILRLDPQGMKKVKQVYPNAVTIFIVPPNPETWLERLINRGSDSDEDLRVRIETASEEIKSIPEFDYVVVNDQLDKAVEDVLTILRAEHLRTTRIKVEHD